jgi:hypothetical protein
VLIGGSRAEQHVIVQVGLAVTIETVGEAHDVLPSCGAVEVFTAASISYDECVFFEVGHRGSHRGTMRIDDTVGTIGINRKEHRDRPRCRDDQIVASNLRALAGDKYSLYPRGIASITRPAQPPARPAVAHAVEFVGTVVREVRDVVRVM